MWQVPTVLTLPEIDKALTNAQQIPVVKRGGGWSAMVDALLEQRAALTTTSKETR